jgi:aminoglycoside 3-N-acetyltransferase
MQPPSSDSESGLTQAEIADALRQTGIKSGEVVLVHSAMRTLGQITGGARTVVDAFLEILGDGGTLVAPTFTFVHEAEEDPIIDPRNDRSEMGAISESVRTHPQALRSIAYRHSFAAIGRRAEVITGIDPALSVFDLRSAFGVMLSLNTQVMVLGMTYSSSTSHHFAEWVCDVPYRRKFDLNVKVRKQDGTVSPQAMTDYQPDNYKGSRRPDFNRLGRMLEEQGRSVACAVGNAAARRFPMRDLIDLAQVEAAKDYNVFRTAEGDTKAFTPLEFGNIVHSPEMLDAAGRTNHYQWCVVDESKLALP